MARRRIRGLTFFTYDIAAMLKNATLLLIMDSPGGLLPCNLHF